MREKRRWRKGEGILSFNFPVQLSWRKGEEQRKREGIFISFIHLGLHTLDQHSTYNKREEG